MAYTNTLTVKVNILAWYLLFGNFGTVSLVTGLGITYYRFHQNTCLGTLNPSLTIYLAPLKRAPRGMDYWFQHLRLSNMDGVGRMWWELRVIWETPKVSMLSK